MDRENAIRNYKFICADLGDGITYHIAPEVYDDCMDAIGSVQRASDYGRDITSREFAEDFYTAYKTIERENRIKKENS